MICDNCQLEDNQSHRCRSKEASCIDGKDCPDYKEQCDCKQCQLIEKIAEEFDG